MSPIATKEGNFKDSGNSGGNPTTSSTNTTSGDEVLTATPSIGTQIPPSIKDQKPQIVQTHQDDTIQAQPSIQQQRCSMDTVNTMTPTSSAANPSNNPPVTIDTVPQTVPHHSNTNTTPTTDVISNTTSSAASLIQEHDSMVDTNHITEIIDTHPEIHMEDIVDIPYTTKDNIYNKVTLTPLSKEAQKMVQQHDILIQPSQQVHASIMPMEDSKDIINEKELLLDTTNDTKTNTNNTTNITDDNNNNNNNNDNTTITVSPQIVSPTIVSSTVKDKTLLDSIILQCQQVVKSLSSTDQAQQSFKQIARLLQNFLRKPNDKKTRHIRSDNFVIRRYVQSHESLKKLFEIQGFHEQLIDGKLYQVIDEDVPHINELENISHLQQDFNMKTVEQQYNNLFISSYANNTVTSQSQSQDTKQKNNTNKKSTLSQPILAPCANHCGFYGTEENNGLCSVCFKRKKEQNANGNNNKSSLQHKSTNTSTRRKLTPRQRLRVQQLKVRCICRFRRARKLVQENKDRCWECNRKLGITGTQCRCGYIFCGKHRYADEHKCTFDHYKSHQTTLAKANQKIQSRKFERISDDQYIFV